MKKVKNFTKQTMFFDTISKRDKAYKEGFYYQSIMLDYALIEDRLNEFLKNLGIANETDCGLTVTKRTKNEIRELLHLNEKSHFGINKISVKLDIIRNLVEYDGNSDYLADSHSILIKKIDKESLCSLIKSIEGWKDKRNGFVHGLLNRVPAECDDTIRELASEGKPLFRELDKYCRRIEKCGIRSKYRIQPYSVK